MTNVAFHSIDEIDDCSIFLDEYQVALDAGLTPEAAFKAVVPYSRDNARTPFQWDATANAGFTTGTPWLKVNPMHYTDINAAEQANRPDSMYHWYKELIALRKNPEYKDVVVYGEFVPYKEEQTNLMAYYRKGTDRTLLVSCQLSARCSGRCSSWNLQKSADEQSGHTGSQRRYPSYARLSGSNFRDVMIPIRSAQIVM